MAKYVSDNYDESKKIYVYKINIKKGRFDELTSCDVEGFNNGTSLSHLRAWYDIGKSKSRYKKHSELIPLKAGKVEVKYLDPVYIVWFRDPQKERAKKLLLKEIKKDRKELEEKLASLNNAVSILEESEEK